MGRWLLILIAVSIPAIALSYEVDILSGDFDCSYKDILSVDNAGDPNCQHEWVYKQPDNSNASLAIYCPCGCGNSPEVKICRKCLRKESKKTIGTVVQRGESEFDILNRKLDDKRKE